MSRELPEIIIDSSVLIVEPIKDSRVHLRSILNDMGFRGVTESMDFSQGLQRLNDSCAKYVIFTLSDRKMSPEIFLKELLKINAGVIPVVCSGNISPDDLFALLRLGAKGFLAKPFTSNTVEQSLRQATKGITIPDEVKEAGDRNEAFVAVMAAKLDETARAMKNAHRSKSSADSVPQLMESLRRSANIANTFSKGGMEELLKTMQDVYIQRSEKEPKTRLGKVRKKLRTTRTEVKERQDDPE